MKICSGCGSNKALTEFQMKRGKPQSQCKACRSAYMSGYYQENLLRERTKRKDWYGKNKLNVSIKGKIQRQANPEKYNMVRRLKKYGITKDQYLSKLQENNNSCEICLKPFTDTPAIDHCHTSLSFRSLLCDNCNTGFGLLKEDLATFERCIAYIKKYKK